MYWSEDDIHTLVKQGHIHIIGEQLPSRPLLSEKAFMAAVIKVAIKNHWKVFHPFDSRKSVPGYPDLTMAKPGFPVIFAELKVGDEKPTIEQEAWLDTLSQAQNTSVHLWYPHDWHLIQEVLRSV